jgi:hypothetical protein
MPNRESYPDTPRLPRTHHAPRRAAGLVALAAGVVLTVAAERAAQAQVNAEPFRKRIKQAGYSFFMQGTFDAVTGNSRGLTADGLIGGGFASGRHLAFLFASVDYSKINETLGVDKSFVHARYVYELTRLVSWEFFLQEQSDTFELIKTRQLVGAGPRLAFYDEKNFGLFFGVAYMAERDVYDLKIGSTDDRQQQFSRASAYITAHATLSDGVDTVTTTYAQPNILNPANIRILSENGFVFKISTWLSTSISFVAHYDSRPVAGVLPTDTELKNAITLTL